MYVNNNYDNIYVYIYICIYLHFLHRSSAVDQGHLFPEALQPAAAVVVVAAATAVVATSSLYWHKCKSVGF